MATVAVGISAAAEKVGTGRVGIGPVRVYVGKLAAAPSKPPTVVGGQA